MRNVFAFVALATSLALCAPAADVTLPARYDHFQSRAARGMAILEGGRIKPLEVAATEAMQLIHGRAKLAKRYDAVTAYLALAVYGDSLAFKPCISLMHKGLRKSLGLPEDGFYASFRELVKSDKLGQILSQVQAKRAEKSPLTPEEKAAEELSHRLERFQAIASGAELRLLPGVVGDEGQWRSLNELTSGELLNAPELSGRALGVSLFLEAFAKGDQARFDAAASGLAKNELLTERGLRRKEGQALHTRAWNVAVELSYLYLKPFRWVWVLLLCAFLAALVGQVLSSTRQAVGKRLGQVAGGVTVVALGFMAAGFAMRVIASGRAPVTNMYETTLWVGFGATLFGLAIAAIYRSRAVLASAAAAGTIVFVLADSLPSVLNPQLQPLVPVLRSNFWLTLHVLTVTISYAAFLVAMAIGNLGLAQAFRSGSDAFQKELAHWSYRAMQLGVLLLTAGILLGGIWADYSWGRFWGWDPKETWSLIADLGYLAILHGRFSGWVRTWGTLLGSVIAFYGVVMAWYGVNFILASGLHSYGFSEGGAAAMGLYAVVQGIWIAICHVRRKQG